MELYTLVLPSGENGNEIMVLTDIIVRKDEAYPVFKDITYAQPIYLSIVDLEDLIGKYSLQRYNLWTIDQIEELVEHMD